MRKLCRTCFMFYCMFYFTCDRSLNGYTPNNIRSMAWDFARRRLIDKFILCRRPFSHIRRKLPIGLNLSLCGAAALFMASRPLQSFLSLSITWRSANSISYSRRNTFAIQRRRPDADYVQLPGHITFALTGSARVSWLLT